MLRYRKYFGKMQSGQITDHEVASELSIPIDKIHLKFCKYVKHKRWRNKLCEIVSSVVEPIVQFFLDI